MPLPLQTDPADTVVTRDRFGKDHWSLLAYVETVCVDGSKIEGFGSMDHRRLRANPGRHPMHAHSGGWDDRYSTRLFGFFDNQLYHVHAEPTRIIGHDDWDCLNDLEAAGYIEVLSEANCLVTMTQGGNDVVAQLRKFKTSGGSFSTFRLPEGAGARC